MPASGLTKWLVAGLVVLVLGPAASLAAPAEEPSLGDKIKKFLATPTPTPSHRRRKHKQGNPSPSPSPSPKAKQRTSPTPAPEEEETPKPKRKNTSSTSSPPISPTPSPTETPTPTEGSAESPSPTVTPSSTPKTKVATISSDEIQDYDKNPAAVRQLLDDALELTRRNLDYIYGSADPERGGMDCSGFIYHVLRKNGVSDVPRDASEQYVWVRKAGNFRAVLSREIDSFELDELKPGDLLFWTGTYSVERDPPVTHTMIYLGKVKKSGRPIMVGASDGRTYEGEQQFGVSVFDFKTTRVKDASTADAHPRFVGYGKIPGLGELKP